MAIVTALWGDENFTTGSARLLATLAPTAGVGGAGAAINLSHAAKLPGSAVAAVGQPERHPAGNGFGPNFGGWQRQAFEVAEGTILAVAGQRFSPASNGNLGTTMATALVLVRAEAALRRVSMRLTGHPRATFQRAFVEGRFDLLGVRDATRMGVLVPAQAWRRYSADAVAGTFTVEVLDPERRPRPRVETAVVEDAAGNRTEVRTVRPMRSIDV